MTMETDAPASVHYLDDYGPLKAERGSLVNLVDWVRFVARSNDAPVLSTGRDLLRRLRADTSIALYVTRPLDLALRVPDEARVPALDRIAAVWSSARSIDDMNPQWRETGGVLALLRAEAFELEGWTDPDGDRKSYTPSPGIDWSTRAAASKWSDAYRDELFRMRHQFGMTDGEIAEMVGVERARIGQLIGPKHAHRSGSWPDKWQPSQRLLAECGLEVRPLELRQVQGGRSASTG